MASGDVVLDQGPRATDGSGKGAGATGAAGDEALSQAQSHRIEEALRTARSETGLHFSVFLGDVEPRAGDDARAAAELLHAALPDSRSAVLVVVSPGARRAEVVTGEAARRRVDDRAAGLAVLSMTTAFSVGDLTGGIVTGVSMLGDAAGRVGAVAEG